MQLIAPDLVLPLTEAGSGAARKFRVAGLREGLAWSQREWTKVTADTGVGNPSASTPGKGRRFFETVTQKVGEFLVDLGEADVNDMYE